MNWSTTKNKCREEMMVKMHLALKQQRLCPNLNDAVITSLSRLFFSSPFIQKLVSSVWMWSGRPALAFRCNLDKHLHAAASLNSPGLKSYKQLYLFYAPLRKLCHSSPSLRAPALFTGHAVRDTSRPRLMEFCEKLAPHVPCLQ